MARAREDAACGPSKGSVASGIAEPATEDRARAGTLTGRTLRHGGIAPDGTRADPNGDQRQGNTQAVRALGSSRCTAEIPAIESGTSAVCSGSDAESGYLRIGSRFRRGRENHVPESDSTLV